MTTLQQLNKIVKTIAANNIFTVYDDNEGGVVRTYKCIFRGIDTELQLTVKGTELDPKGWVMYIGGKRAQKYHGQKLESTLSDASLVYLLRGRDGAMQKASELRAQIEVLKQQAYEYENMVLYSSF